MDFKTFEEACIRYKTIFYAMRGMEKSDFYPDSSFAPQLIKRILQVLIPPENQKVYNQLQSGGISLLQVTKGVVSKKLSFCTEFPKSINNIIALIGNEFVKFLLTWMSLKLQIQRIINDMSNDKTYQKLKTHIQIIYNILQKEGSDGTRIFKIVGFDPKKYTIGANFVDYSTDEEFSYDGDLGSIDVIANLLLKIDKLILSNSIIMLDRDKCLWQTILRDIYAHIQVEPYVINTVEDLRCLTTSYNLGSVITPLVESIEELTEMLGDYNVGSDKSFIGGFERLYDEMFTKTDLDFSGKDISDLFKKNKIENYKECMAEITKYIYEMFKLAEDTAKEDNTYTVPVVITEEFVYHFASLILNALYVVAKNIATLQITQSYCGKSNRIQFAQIQMATLTSQPRSIEFSKLQCVILYYALLTEKTLKDSYEVLMKNSS